MASGSENLSLTPFQFEGRNVRLIERDGETWFVAADVARELGYRDAADLIRNSDADERGTHNMRTPSGDQEMSIVSEPGVYRAIIQRRANKKHDASLTAKITRFQRFVFHDVLPSIRQTGSYSPTATAPAPPKSYAEALRELATTVETVERQQAEIAVMAPKAAFVDRFVEADGLYGYQNAGRALGCRPNKFVNWLKQKYVFYAEDALVPYVQFVQAGLFVVKSRIGTDDKAHSQGFITAKGVEYFSTRVPLDIKSYPEQGALITSVTQEARVSA